MGRLISYAVFDKDIDKDEVIAEIERDMEFNHSDSCAYHGPLRWHTATVYECYEDAEAAIRDFDRGFYDDHAVLFHDARDLDNAAIRRFDKQISDTKQKLRDYIDSSHVNTRKAAFIGCPCCGSKLSREHLYRDTCPLCHTDLRSETVLSRIKGYEDKIEELKKKIVEERKKLASKAPVKWLVKYEFHI